MLQTLESLLDALALVVEVAEGDGRHLIGRQVGHQHAQPRACGGVAHQTYCGREGRASPVGGVLQLGRCQLHQGLGLIAVHERAQRRPSAAAGGVAPHDEADTPVIEQIDQPRGRVAAVEQQHIVGAELVQRLHQHRTLGGAAAVHGRMQREFGRWQIHRKQALIGRSSAAREVTAAYCGHQHRSVGRHQAQALPTRDQASSVDSGQQMVIEPGQRRSVQPSTGLREGPIGDNPHQWTIATEAAEEGIEQHLLGRRAHAQQRRHQCGQRQAACAGEGAGAVGVTGTLREGVRRKDAGQVQKEILDSGRNLSSYREMNSETVIISMTYGLVKLKFGALGGQPNADAGTR
jgi:hypothetical protein